MVISFLVLWTVCLIYSLVFFFIIIIIIIIIIYSLGFFASALADGFSLELSNS